MVVCQISCHMCDYGDILMNSKFTKKRTSKESNVSTTRV